MKKIRKEAGNKIRGLRKKEGFTQERLAERAGLSYKFLGEVERGQVNISLDSLEKIAKALGVDVINLFSDRKVSVKKVFINKNDNLSKLSKKEIQLVKKAIRVLAKVF